VLTLELSYVWGSLRLHRVSNSGHERPIRLATKMNTHIALRQAGIGQLQPFTGDRRRAG